MFSFGAQSLNPRRPSSLARGLRVWLLERESLVSNSNSTVLATSPEVNWSNQLSLSFLICKTGRLNDIPLRVLSGAGGITRTNYLIWYLVLNKDWVLILQNLSQVLIRKLCPYWKIKLIYTCIYIYIHMLQFHCIPNTIYRKTMYAYFLKHSPLLKLYNFPGLWGGI